ncbi:MAG TPA: hypothetical protein ENN19_12555 [Chloroflexi bacterium]|nr:hypothetical protein [Chloroflexota bacterium]
MDEVRSVDRWVRLKIFSGLVVIAFVVTLAWVVGNRLSNEALSVLAGAACGVGAAIPTSLLIVAVSRRREEPRTSASAVQGAYPPLIVVTPPGNGSLAGHAPYTSMGASMASPVERQFTVVGGPSERSAGRKEGFDERYA